MVRQLAIDFAYRKTDKETKQESESIGIAVAFAAAEGKRKGKTQIARLSRVSFPFWIVQISADSSILLSTTGLTKQIIELSENKKLSEARRIISSEITDASVIPDVIETLLPLLKTIEQNSFTLDDIEVPDVIVSNGNLAFELELTANPNRLESKIDSQLALKASESFQNLRDVATARAERLEELKSLVKEKLRSHLNVLENMVILEKKRWAERISAYEERTKQETVALDAKKKDEISHLKDSEKIHLQAVTADFARSMSELEGFFEQVISRIKETRVSIGKKGDDVEGAVSDYQTLIDFLSKTVPQYSDVIKKMDAKSDSVLQKMSEVKQSSEQETGATKESIDSEISEKQQKLIDLAEERAEEERKLEVLIEDATIAIRRIEGAIQNRILELQKELLDLMAYSLDNNSISNLAPLTRFDVNTFVVSFNDGSHNLLTPCSTPHTRIKVKYKHQPIDSSLDKFLQDLLKEWMKDSGFKKSFEKTCIDGNILLDPDARENFDEGLGLMQRGQLFEEGVSEKLTRLWDKYSGKCPKCGEIIGVDVKFCPSCGATT